MVREAVSVAFSHVLSSYDEPVNIARKKYNVSNPSNNKSDRDVNPIDKTMAIPRASLASKAKKPFIKRLRLFSGNKRRSMISKDQASRPLHKNHKSDEIDRVRCPLQTLNKPSPIHNKNTKKHSIIDVSTGSSKSEVVLPSSTVIPSSNTKPKTKRNKKHHSVDEYVQGLYNKGDYSAKYDEA
eukprot:742188_1